MIQVRALVAAFVFAVTSVAGPITIHLAGDSTMAAKLPQKRPETGWGEMLQQYFDSTTVRVVNHAQNGRSTRTFISEGRWQRIVDSLTAGDYVFIQFGHNDESKAKTDRYTPPADYRNNLVRFVRETRAKGANPVLFTPVARRRFHTKGDFYDTHGEYPDIVRSVAASEHVPLVDMTKTTGAMLRLFGPEASVAMFLQLAPGENPNYPNGIQDNTHFSPFGARIMASLAVEGIRAAHVDLASHFRRIPPPIVPAAVKDTSGL
jgi:lysophospholipase L1-like esterase